MTSQPHPLINPYFLGSLKKCTAIPGVYADILLPGPKISDLVAFTTFPPVNNPLLSQSMTEFTFGSHPTSLDDAKALHCIPAPSISKLNNLLDKGLRAL